MTTIKYALQYTRKGFTQQEPVSEVTVLSLHSFRRAFAINCLRKGMDINSLQALMEHADLRVLIRYLKQSNSDLRFAHAKSSPVDFEF